MKCECFSHNGFLTRAGYALLDQRGGGPQELHEWSDMCYLDKVGSVSGLELERDLYAIQTSDQLLEQSERFLNGL